MEPFDTLRNQLVGWTVSIAAIEAEHGVIGYCDPDSRTIWVDVALPDRERRSTIMHEIVHALRGDTHDNPAIEALVNVETARRLLPAAALAAALHRTPHPEDLCDALDVDLDVLETRMRNLDPEEQSAVRRALSAHTLPDPTRPALCAKGRWWVAYGMPGEPPCLVNHPPLTVTARSIREQMRAHRDTLTPPAVPVLTPVDLAARRHRVNITTAG